MNEQSPQSDQNNCNDTEEQHQNDGSPSTATTGETDAPDALVMESGLETTEQMDEDSPPSLDWQSAAETGNCTPQQASLGTAATETGAACAAMSPASAADEEEEPVFHDADDDDDDDEMDDVGEEEEEEEEDDGDEEETGGERLSQTAATLFEASSTTTNAADSSAMSVTSAADDEDEEDDEAASDVASSIADSEIADSATASGGSTVAKKARKRSRQPPIMIGYRKRRKVQHAAARKYEEEGAPVAAVGTLRLRVPLASPAPGETATTAWEGDDRSESSRKSLEQSSSEENLFESAARGSRKYSSVANEANGADKFCWICHKDGGRMLKCIVCPRVYHCKCHFQAGVPENPNYDPSNFHCPECSAILKADNVDTRSPVLVTVNLEQLCTLLKNIISILKSQKDSHVFWGPVDTKEFPDYRQYVVYPMDISMLEKNIKNKVYGCTEAFLADVKWIVHNSIVFNTRAAKITTVAKNLLKLCKREILEIETCAECYYNSLVHKDTWFIEACKKPHLLVWARLKGYPPWPAKAMKCKDGMVDCRFFGAHDKAWVPLKDCYLYSKVSPQPVKVKKGSHLESGIQELEKHIKKLLDKFGSFVYPTARIPYRPSQESEQLRMMLPNYNPSNSSRPTKYLIHLDRIRDNLHPKILFNDGDEKAAAADEESATGEHEAKATPEEADGDEANLSEELEKTSDSPPHHDSAVEDSSFESSSETELSSTAAADATPPRCFAAAATPASSPSKSGSEPPTPPRRLVVSVKNIASINASVPTTPSASPTSRRSPDRPSLRQAAPADGGDGSPKEDFDLNKVKDEPLDCREAEAVAESAAAAKRPLEVAAERAPPPAKKPADAKCRTVNITENVTLSLINQSPDPARNRPPAPKPKATKPVPATVPLVAPPRAAATIVVNTSTTGPTTARLVYGVPSQADLQMLRAKANVPSQGGGLVASRPNTKVQPRIVNPVAQTNGTLCVTSKPAVTVTPSRASPKISESYNDLFNKTMNEYVAECHTQFRRIFESALDKLVEKGDPRGLVVTLKKEMDIMKRNHDLVMDEMRRDYEVQIAELRATSLAKVQFDLAAERLKFEQEKERAVREAKSKQWCSNCQKIANYYCCWNTAYCDFECQKEHWSQHMHVCKNDVKKKAAESSENEPPAAEIQISDECKIVYSASTERIMMQSEISNGYQTTNGYDKTGSTFSYGNVGAPIVTAHAGARAVSNYSRPRTKVSSLVRTSRPLLPRTAGSVITPSSNSSTINGVAVHSTYQNSRPPAYTIGSSGATVYSSLYQK